MAFSLSLSLSLLPFSFSLTSCCLYLQKKQCASFVAWKILNVHRDIAIKRFCSIKNFPRTENNYYCYTWQAIHSHNSQIHVHPTIFAYWKLREIWLRSLLFFFSIHSVSWQNHNSRSISVQPLFSTHRTLCTYPRAKQTERFILNDMKKRLGDLCAQIVLSLCRCSGSCCSSSSDPCPLFFFCRHLIGRAPAFSNI